MYADTNARDLESRTALMIASSNGQKKVVELLVQFKADVNAIDLLGTTALIEASSNGHKDIVELLIERNADVNTKNLFGTTALMKASLNGHKDVVELLIRKKADVNAKNCFDKTALMEASSSGHKDIVELLIERNADVNKKNFRGTTALMEASSNGHKDVVKLLLQHNADVETKNSRGKTALMEACLNGHREIAELLMQQHKANVNANDWGGGTAVVNKLYYDTSTVDESFEFIQIKSNIQIYVTSNNSDALFEILKLKRPVDIFNSNLDMQIWLHNEICRIVKRKNTFDAKKRRIRRFQFRFGQKQLPSTQLLDLSEQFSKFDNKNLFPDVILFKVNNKQDCLLWLKNCPLREFYAFLNKINGYELLNKRIPHMAAALGRDNFLLILHLKGYDISLKDEYGLNPLFYAALNRKHSATIFLMVFKPMKLFEDCDFHTRYMMETSANADYDRLAEMIYQTITTYLEVESCIKQFKNNKILQNLKNALNTAMNEKMRQKSLNKELIKKDLDVNGLSFKAENENTTDTNQNHNELYARQRWLDGYKKYEISKFSTKKIDEPCYHNKMAYRLKMFLNETLANKTNGFCSSFENIIYKEVDVSLICRYTFCGIHFLKNPLRLPCGHTACMYCVMHSAIQSAENEVFCCTQYKKKLNCENLLSMKIMCDPLVERLPGTSTNLFRTIKLSINIVENRKDNYQKGFEFLEQEIELHFKSIKTRIDVISEKMLNGINRLKVKDDIRGNKIDDFEKLLKLSCNKKDFKIIKKSDLGCLLEQQNHINENRKSENLIADAEKLYRYLNKLQSTR